MRGSLVILVALCLVAAAEASSVRFVSSDEGQNSGKETKDRNGVSEGFDSAITKSIDDVVKKIDEEAVRSEKEVKNSELEKSPADKKSTNLKEAVKKSAVPEKSKIHKRDVRRALDLSAKRAMKRADAGEAKSGWDILNTRKLALKYLSLQKIVISKVTAGLIHIVDHIAADQNEKEALLLILNRFKANVEQTYDTAIQQLQNSDQTTSVALRKKFMRADDLPGLVTSLNQRNPLSLNPIGTRLIRAISTGADIASTFTSRSDSPDYENNVETLEKIFSQQMPMTMDLDPTEY